MSSITFQNGIKTVTNSCLSLLYKKSIKNVHFEQFKKRENEVPIGAFFSFRGVRGTFLFIRKKEKFPLKLRCSLNNKNAMGRTCSAKQI